MEINNEMHYTVSSDEQNDQNAKENNNEGSEETDASLSKEEIIDQIMELKEEKNNLETKNAILLQELSYLIENGSDKDYYNNVSLPEEIDETTFAELLEEANKKKQEIVTLEERKHEEMESLKRKIAEKEKEYNELHASFQILKEKTATESVNCDSGEKFTREEIKSLLCKELDAAKKLRHLQEESIKKENSLQEVIQKKKNLVEGPVDYGEYEIMCTEIETFKDVSRELEEKIQELKRKSLEMANIESHLMQTLQTVEAEKSSVENKKKILEEELNEMRDSLFQEKKKFNNMKEKTEELQHRHLLLQHPNLLEDYKEKKAENVEGQEQLGKLKTSYANCMKIVSKFS